MRSKKLTMKLNFLILLLLLTLRISAQTGKFYNTDNQLPSSFVNQVYQDSQGYIWIATRNGLSRYDGYQFKNFTNDDLTSAYINCICEDSKHDLYFGSNTNVQRFHNGAFETIHLYDKNTKREISTYVTSIIENKQGKILISTSGYGLLQLKDNTAMALGGATAKVLFIRKMVEDSKGRLWIIDDKQGLLCVFHNKLQKVSIPKETRTYLRDICEDARGNIYVATIGQGLFKLNNSNQTFEKIPAAGNLPISSFHITRNGLFLLGCDGNGLYTFDPKTNLITNNPFYSPETDLTHTKVYSIIEDQSGNIWLGLFQKGVFMQPIQHSIFGYLGAKLGTHNVIGSNCVSAVLRDHLGNLWVGTDKDGLYLLDSHRNLIRHYTNVPSTILALTETKDGKIWLGSYEEGMGYVSASSSAYTPHNLNIGEHTSVYTIAKDHHDNLWIGTMGQGIIYLDPSTGKQKRFVAPLNNNTRHMNCLTNNFIGKIILSRDGKRMYAATSVGVVCLDLTKNSWLSTFGVNCPNFGTYCTTVHEGMDGFIYVGTNYGLYRYDLKNKKTKIITVKDGLPCNGIASIEHDHLGRLWIGTYHGLCCMNPKNLNMNCFYTDKGLQGNEFTDGASFMTLDGRYAFFGGVGGVTWFETDAKLNQTWKANVTLTSIVSGNQEILGYMEDDKSENEEYTFDYEDNSLSLHLSTLTYDDPDNITYLYSINNEKWNKLQPGSNEINFSHLSPGTYHFRVKAMLNNQQSNEKEFTIIVKSPWYRSSIAYLFYIILLVLGIFEYLQYRKRREEARLKLQEHIHAEEMGEAKLKFFMNISHEIRTPMTLIISPLLQLMKENKDVHHQHVYETMRRNAERILHLINQMMDLRKIDKGQMAMHMRETNMISFIDDVRTLFAEQARNKKINLKFEHDCDSLPVWIDRSNFDKILVNIISNAFKYTKVGGNITIKLTHTAEECKIAISDDGEKIAEDKLERIFDRFYQTPTTANDRHIGTGIGLDLTRSLVELHYGNIEAHNNEDKGCEFVVTIPLGNEHLKPEEMISDSLDAEEEKRIEAQNDVEETIVEDDLEDVLNTETTGKGKRTTVAIVEDDEEISKYLESELGRDYKITTYPNGKDALEGILRKERPNLVISDVMMPEMDGNTLCANLKNNINTNDIPVILLTAKSRDEDRLEGLETGADAFIVKPFNMDILRRTVVNLLQQRQTLRNKFNGNESQKSRIDEIKMQSPDEKLLERIMGVINANISNPELSVNMISEQVGISRVHLYRKMKELTNQTPHGFIRNIRLQQAAKLLKQQGQNVTDVMYACGFNNPASFSTTFKALYGVSPRDYMNQK